MLKVNKQFEIDKAEDNLVETTYGEPVEILKVYGADKEYPVECIVSDEDDTKQKMIFDRKGYAKENAENGRNYTIRFKCIEWQIGDVVILTNLLTQDNIREDCIAVISNAEDQDSLKFAYAVSVGNLAKIDTFFPEYSMQDVLDLYFSDEKPKLKYDSIHLACNDIRLDYEAFLRLVCKRSIDTTHHQIMHTKHWSSEDVSSTDYIASEKDDNMLTKISEILCSTTDFEPTDSSVVTIGNREHRLSDLLNDYNKACSTLKEIREVLGNMF